MLHEPQPAVVATDSKAATESLSARLSARRLERSRSRIIGRDEPSAASPDASSSSSSSPPVLTYEEKLARARAEHAATIAVSTADRHKAASMSPADIEAARAARLAAEQQAQKLWKRLLSTPHVSSANRGAGENAIQTPRPKALTPRSTPTIAPACNGPGASPRPMQPLEADVEEPQGAGNFLDRVSTDIAPAETDDGEEEVAVSTSSEEMLARSAARIVRQPGDGSCLFHAIAHGLRDGSTAATLRREVVAYVFEHPKLAISDTPLEEWIKWDSNGSVDAYCRRMAQPTVWGGGIEMAAISCMKRVHVYVYERDANSGGYKLISSFEGSGAGLKAVRVFYDGGVHYDALEI